MKPHRTREKYQRAFGILAAVAVLASVAFFLVFFVPARAEYLSLEREIARFDLEDVQRKLRLEQLQVTSTRLEEAQREGLQALGARMVPRGEGFAAILLDLEHIAQRSGISRARVQYAAESEPRHGAYAVRISLPVRGDYVAVKRFIRELEASETLFILDSIGLNRREADGSGLIELSLQLTTFFAHES